MENLTEQQKAIKVKYDNLLHKFLEINLSKREENVDESTKPHREVIDQLYKLYNFTNFFYDEYYLVLEPIELKIVMGDLLIKAAQTVYAVYLTLDKYLERDAATLCRSLLELYLHVMLMFEKDTDERIELYKNFFIILKYKEFKRGKLKIDDEDEKKRLIENYEKYKDNYNPGNATTWYWKLFKDELDNGREPNLYMVAMRLGGHSEIMFKNLYSVLSKTTHPNPAGANILNMADNIGCFTIIFCCEIYQHVIDYYKIKDYEELIEYFTIFYEVCFKEQNLNENGES